MSATEKPGDERRRGLSGSGVAWCGVRALLELRGEDREPGHVGGAGDTESIVQVVGGAVAVPGRCLDQGLKGVTAQASVF